MAHYVMIALSCLITINAIVFVFNVGRYDLNGYRVVNFVACLIQLYLSTMFDSPTIATIWGVAFLFWAMTTAAREQLDDIQKELR